MSHLFKSQGNNNKKEMEQILKKLESGTTLTKFYSKGKPESRFFTVRRDTRQLLWFSRGQEEGVQGTNVKNGSEEGSLDFREIKEVRMGRHCKMFEKTPEDAKKWDSSHCFVVLYGNAFRLKILACSASSLKDCEHWVKGIKFLMEETLKGSTLLHVNVWIRKEFKGTRNPRETVSMKDLKPFLTRINCKLSMNRLKEIYQELTGSTPNGEVSRTLDLSFESFILFYHTILHDNFKIFKEYFATYSSCPPNDLDKSITRIISFQDLYRFLTTEQKEKKSRFHDKQFLFEFMREYLLPKSIIPTLNGTNNTPLSPSSNNHNHYQEDYTVLGKSKTRDETRNETRDETRDETQPQESLEFLPNLTFNQFIDFLFSKENDAWDPYFSDTIYQNMSRPLSAYWVASSHNTYLTGDQFRSESTTDAYARCLRMGCRCIERKSASFPLVLSYFLLTLCLISKSLSLWTVAHE